MFLLQGIVNQVFQKDDEESIMSEQDGANDEANEDKKHIARIKVIINLYLLCIFLKRYCLLAGLFVSS